MFLIVFLTLVISIIGLFAQVVTLQAAQMAASQTGLAQTMETWHSVAVGAVYTATATAKAKGAAAPTVSAAGCGVGVGMNGANCVDMTANLPPGSPGNYSFSSILFQAPAPLTAEYVITYVIPGTDGYLSANGASTGYTAGALLSQLNRQASLLTYGTVSASGSLAVAPSSTVATALTYPIPASIPIGSIGIISVAD
jgi:hypothetical protein